MAISDKVIELETKKKGRTALFIVFIAILAAASAAFAVLWILKKPATDPPSIEKMVMFKSDLAQSGIESESSLPIYTVSPSCSYSVEFDLVLKDGSTPENTNSLLNIQTQPTDNLIDYTGKLVKVEQQSSDEDSEDGKKSPLRYRYKLEFFVRPTVTTNFDIVISSAYSSTVGMRIPLSVDLNSHTDFFDVKPSGNGDYRLYNRNNTSDFTLLKLDENKSSETRRYYTAKLVYYEDNAGSMKNAAYQLDMEQLGKIGENGLRAKVYSGSGAGTRLDTVKVEAGLGDSAETAKYTVIGDTYKNSSLTFPDIGRYYHDIVCFQALKADKNFIKLTANAFNSAEEKEILIEVEFISSNSLNEVTEIVFTDPYDSSKISAGKDKAEVNFYLYGRSTMSFMLSDFISVRRGSDKIEEADWDTGGLDMTFVKEEDSEDLFVRDASVAKGIKLNLKGTTKTGACTVRVFDTGGFKAQKEITINVIAPITDATPYVNSPVRVEKNISVPTTSDNSETVKVDFELPEGVKYSDLKNALHSTEDALNAKLTVKYPKELNPLTSASKPSDADYTIDINGLKNLEITPTLSGADKNVATGELKFHIGDKVQTGEYRFDFELDSQGFVYSDGIYTPNDKLRFSVTFNVTHLADSFALDTAFFDDISGKTEYADDRFTELTVNNKEKTAVLTLIAGTGKNGYTSFKLADFLLFYDDSGKLVTNSADITVNLNGITVEDNGAMSGEISVSNRRFTVPATLTESKEVVLSLGDFRFKLIVEYKLAPREITVRDPSVVREFSYSAPDPQNGVLLSNGKSADLNDDNGDNMTVYAYGNGNIITLASQMKHPELLNFDIAFLRGTTARVLLSKKAIDESIYYFLPGTSSQDMTADKAIFRVGYNHPLKGYNVTLLKDLFSLGNSANSITDSGNYLYQANFQKLYFIYSYGTVGVGGSNDDDTIVNDNLGGNAMLINERNVITAMDPYLVAFTQWNLTRRLDGVKIYSNENYDSAQADGLEKQYLDNQEFKVYYSGVINLSDGREFVVERDNKLLNYACETVNEPVITYSENVSSYIVKIDKNTFKALCSQGETISGGVISYSDALNIYRATVNIKVSNTAVKIQNVEYFMSNPELDANATPIENFNYTLFLGGVDSVTLYYRVTWAPYKEGDSTFESFKVSNIQGLIIDADIPKKFDVKPSDKVEIGESHKVSGFITVTLSGAANGDYSFMIEPASSINATSSCNIHVTTLIDGKFGAIPDGNAANKIAAEHGAGNAQQIKEFEYEFSATSGANNEHNFEFDFITNKNNTVDVNNLTFSANVISGVDGAFYSKDNRVWSNNGGDFSSDGGYESIVGYRITLNNRRVDKTQLTINVTEKYTQYENGNFVEKSNVYYIKLNLSVDVPVTDIEATLKKDGDENAIIVQGGGEAVFTTDGKTGENNGKIEVAYNLGVIINGVNGEDTEFKLPFDTSAVFVLSAAGEQQAFRLDGANKILYVNTSNTTPVTAKLGITVKNKTIEITLKSQTAKRNIGFVNSEWNSGCTVTDNGNKDFIAFVYDAGDLSEKPLDGISGIKYEVNILSGEQNITVEPIAEGSSIFSVTGTGGTFTVTASYTYTLLGKEETVSVISGIITVDVPFKGIEVVKGDDSVASGSTLTYIVGQTTNVTLNASLKYAVEGIESVTSNLSVSTENEAVAKVNMYQDGVITITPVAAGETTVTVMYDGVQSFTFKARVLPKPSVVIDTEKNNIDVFVSDTLEFNLAVNNIGGYTLNNLQVTVSDEELFTVSENGDNYKVTLNKENNTDKIATAVTNKTKFALGATAELKELPEISLAVSEVYFTLTADGYLPKITLSRANGSVENNEVNKTAVTDYRFTVSEPAAFNPTAIAFECSALNITTNNNVATVTGLKADYVGVRDVMKVSVTVLGITFESEITYNLVDDGVITGELYYSVGAQSDLNALITENGNVNTLLIKAVASQGVPIDYSGNFGSTHIIVIVDYTDAPAAVLNADKDSFTVDASTGLTKSGEYGLVSKNGRYYYIAQFRADKTGYADFSIYTKALGGSAYQAPMLHTELTATKPEFEISDTFVNLTPGGEKELAVTKTENAFAGNVVYEWQFDGAGNGVISFNKLTDISAKVSAAVNHGSLVSGASATVTVTARVSSGALAGYSESFTITVAVLPYTAPAVEVKQTSVWLEGDGSEPFDLGELFNATHDLRDTNFDYEITFDTSSLGEDDGSIANNVFTPAAGKGARNLTLTYTVRVTQGYFKGKNLGVGEITIIVAPSMKWSDAKTEILPNETLDLSVITDTGNVTVENVDYVLSDSRAGFINNGVFTPAYGFGGTVTVYATATVRYANFTGVTATIQKTITLANTGLTVADDAKISATPGEENISFVTAFNLGNGEKSGEGDVFTFNCADSYITDNGDGTLSVSKDANLGARDRVVNITVTVVHNGVTYGGSFDFTIKTIESRPELTKVDNGYTENTDKTGGTLKFTITEGYAADYVYSVIGEGLTVDNNGNYTYVRGREERVVKVIVIATVKTEPFNGAVLSLNIDIAVPKEDEPAIGDIVLGVDAISSDSAINAPITGRLSVLSVPDSITVLYYECDSEYLAVNANGACVIKPSSAENKQVSVTVHYAITKGAYAGEIKSKSSTVTVEKLIALGTPIASDGKITFEHNGYNVDYEVTTGDEFINVAYGSTYGYTYTLTEDANGQIIEITFTATVNNGVYKNHKTAVTVIVPTPPVVEPITYEMTVQVEWIEQTGGIITATVTPQADGVIYSFTADTEGVIELSADGTFTVIAAGKTVVTVTAIIDGIEIAQETKEIVVISVPSQPEQGGEDINTPTEKDENI